MHLIKFSSEDCGTCHRMSHYDGKVAEELGCSFISVMLQDTEMYRKYRKILLKQYPNKAVSYTHLTLPTTTSV